MSPTPNWCHVTLTVRGEADEIARFVQAALPQEEAVRSDYEAAKQVKHDVDHDHLPKWKDYLARAREAQPLSFASIVPEPTKEEYAAIDDLNKVPCYMCGGHGDLPVSAKQAVEREATWHSWMAEREDRKCNVCSGEGRALPSLMDSAWRDWREANWGCKWDASFNGPFMALGAGDEVDVDACVDAQGATITTNVVVYKFDTPWAPPSPFVEHASEQFPELEFVLQYGEPGGGYAGVERYVSGVCVESEEKELEEVLAPEEMWF